jgi:hypothetical protein
MTTITNMLSNATTLFAAVVTLCVLTAGFFLGRRWFLRAGKERDFGYYRKEHFENESFSEYRARSKRWREMGD